MNASSRILIVEDDESLRLALSDNLREQGHEVRGVGTVAEARAALLEKFALVILDLMLPDGDGYGLCREIKSRDAGARVMMLTARSLEEDLVRGFEAGADDYLEKPYRLRELLARVGALLRRPGQTPGDELHFAGLVIDRKARVLSRAGEPIALTKKEFDLLVCLVSHLDQVLTRDQLLDQVWGEGVMVDERTIDNFVSILKKKLGAGPSAGFRIRTVRGVGYRMELSR